MQYGSRHDRHELATRNLSNRRPSRISRVTPVVGVGAGLGALVAARALLQVEDQQALAFISPCRGSRRASRSRSVLQRVAVGAPGDRKASSISGRRTWSGNCEDVVEVGRGDPHEVDVIERGAGGGARPPGAAYGADLGDVRQQADLAEVAAGADVVQDVFAARAGLRDLDEAGADQVEAVVGRGPLAEDRLADALGWVAAAGGDGATCSCQSGMDSTSLQSW